MHDPAATPVLRQPLSSAVPAASGAGKLPEETTCPACNGEFVGASADCASMDNGTSNAARQKPTRRFHKLPGIVPR